MDYKKALEYVGDSNQLMTVLESTLCQGRQEGVKMIQVENGGSLSANVLPGRCLDLYQVRYKGKNMNYIAPCGIQSSEYYNDREFEFLRTFNCGFLTTCGLQHFGAPIEIDGDKRGLHGRIGNTPAENVAYTRSVKNGKPVVEITGTMREARIFGENLRLHRKITFFYEEDAFEIEDTVENCGFGDRQFLLAYHLNYGYPLIDENAQLIINSESVVGRDEHAAKYVKSWKEITPPAYPYPERCYFHKIKPDKNGMAGYAIFNKKAGIGVKVSYKASDLPEFCQWKMLGKGEYVMGMEPLSAPLDGPKLGEKGCKAPNLKPGKTKTYKVRFEFFDKM